MTNTLSPSLWHWSVSLNWLLASLSDNHTGIQKLFEHRHLDSKNLFLYFVILLSNPHLNKHALSQSQKLTKPQNISREIDKALLHVASSLVYRLISVNVRYNHKPFVTNQQICKLKLGKMLRSLLGWRVGTQFCISRLILKHNLKRLAPKDKH